MKIVPVSFRQACEFVKEHHRHNKPPVGHKFSVGLQDEAGQLIGVAMAGRPIARALDDGRTLEVNRTCTNGQKNANSMLYGAIWRAAKALGYVKCLTYTQADESGASLRAVGWRREKDLKPRKNWAQSSSGKLAEKRDSEGPGGVARVLWVIDTPPITE